ncbi:cholecystokinin receptor [Trichomycterus rosablanca]|uniref:cholecystokinin receptor n=1 Tax=Trichomycterus rosablanca TaxID=2290929 RepID=UPI002F35A3AF
MDLENLNELLECLSAVNSTGLNGSLELSDSNSTCGEDFIPIIPAVRTKEMDSVRILLYSLIFLLSIFGNLLIIVVLVVNKRMRTVTNSFLLSLAVSDLMMAVFCMPFTFIPNLLEDFIFGAAMCKIVAYLMGISVSISTFSLMAIAIERYSAICNPLKSRAWQTRSHAYKVIAVTWTLSFLIMTPYPIFSSLVSYTKFNNTTAHMCRHDWPKDQVQQAWCVLLLFILFFFPGVVMIIAYGLISRELYCGIQFELEQKKGQRTQLGGSATVSSGIDHGDGCYIQVLNRPNSMEMSNLTLAASTKVDRPRSNTSEIKLMAKKRVIRMLIVIVTMFFICWMPLYSVNTWKAFHPPSAYRALSGAPISFIHLLAYTSACVNPIIYCFMNKRFRKALLATFSCCCRPCRPQGYKEGDDDVTATGASLSKFNYTTISTMGPC